MNRHHLRELLIHGTIAFPLAVYHNCFQPEISLLAPLHYHDEFELFLVTKGHISVQIEETLYQLSEGEGLFLNSSLLHEINGQNPEEHEFIAVVFHPSLLGNEQEIIYQKYLRPLIEQKILVTPYLDRELCDKIREIEQLYTTGAFGYEMEIKQRLLAVLAHLIKDAPRTSQSSGNSKSQIVKCVLDYIQKEYAQELTLQNLADIVPVSKEYLCRVFQDMSGTSPIVYLNRYRISRSAELLLQTDRQISEISTLCGFNSSSYYNKLFLRYMGCTPKQYRRNHFT